MDQNNCGFRDANGVVGRDLLIELGPTLKVDVGFDPDYSPQTPRRTPILPVSGIWALIDTGASISCIDRALAAHLNMPQIDRKTFLGISGPVDVDMHLAHIHVPTLSFTLYGSFAAMDLAGGHHHVLLGRDFLRNFTMTYDGHSGAVHLHDPLQPTPPDLHISDD
jgi:gag-polyprotein putative aspartyl protease